MQAPKVRPKNQAASKYFMMLAGSFDEKPPCDQNRQSDEPDRSIDHERSASPPHISDTVLVTALRTAPHGGIAPSNVGGAPIVQRMATISASRRAMQTTLSEAGTLAETLSLIRRVGRKLLWSDIGNCTEMLPSQKMLFL